MSRLFCDINGKFYSLSLSISEEILIMPRKKITKRKSQAPTKSFSQAALTKVENEFFTIPDKLVKNATKQLTVLQKKNSKLTKAVSKVTAVADKLEKKLLDIKRSKKVVKRAVASALKKQHQVALKQQAVLSKEHQSIVASLTPLEAFHAKFNFLSKQLVQINKEWATSQKKQAAAKKSNVLTLKAKAKKKKAVSSPHEKATNASDTTAVDLLQVEEVNA